MFLVYAALRFVQTPFLEKIECIDEIKSNRQGGTFMLNEYVNAALATAKYEIIDEEEPYYGEMPDLKGVWLQVHLLRSVNKNSSLY